MGFEVVTSFLKFKCIIKNFLLTLFSFDSDIIDLINDSLNVFNHSIMLSSSFLNIFVYDVDKHFTIISNCTAQGFKIVVNLNNNQNK